MASFSTGEQVAGHELDLSTLLSANERAHLPKLVLDITNAMQKRITDAFDDSPGDTRLSKPKFPLKHNNPGIDTPKLGQETLNAGANNGKGFSKPEQQELKTASLDFLLQWKEAVASRIEEVLSPKEEAKKLSKVDNIAEKPAPITPPRDNKTAMANTNVDDADAALIELYPPISTSLCSLPKDERILLLHAMLLVLLSLEHYAAHSRILLLYISSSLHLPLHVLTENEVRVAQSLIEGAKLLNMSGDDEIKHRSDENKNSRRWKVGLAGVAGAALIGVTGGLAAPLVAAGIGSVMGGLGLGASAVAGLLGTLAESGLVVGTLFGAYGGRMTGKMMDQYAKEVRDFAFLPLRGSKQHWGGARDIPVEEMRLRVTVSISGWLTQKEDTVTPWRALGHGSEVYALRWELEALIKLGASMETLVKSYAWSVAKKEIIARTIFASLMEALWPIALLKVSKIVDNPFSVAKHMADKAGVILADALINRAQGERPVTLIGYSLGARLIFSCLMSLADRRAFGLVESAVLMGTPAASDATVWSAIRSVISGRLVNVYSEHDYILAFLYRTSSIQYGIAGIQDIQDVIGVENFNASELVSGHLRYQYRVGSILEKIGWEDIDLVEVAEEEETLSLLEENEAKEQDEKLESGDGDGDEAAVLEQKVREKTNQRMIEHLSEKLHLRKANAT